jgi:DNA-directed RNA polymerase subunit RPC12/RpoP
MATEKLKNVTNKKSIACKCLSKVLVQFKSTITKNMFFLKKYRYKNGRKKKNNSSTAGLGKFKSTITCFF